MWIDDDMLRRCGEPCAHSVWVPEVTRVVLGRGDTAEREIWLERCQADGVEVLKRYGGGGTVVLYPGCVVVSLGVWVKRRFHNRGYFRLINGAVIRALAERWPACERLSQDGLSDIVDGPKKVVGTSLFRSAHYLLYQASVLVDADISTIERYVRHPSREPEYRGGRSHSDFLRGIDEIVTGITPAQVRDQLDSTLGGIVEEELAGERIAPQPNEFRNLERRAADEHL